MKHSTLIKLVLPAFVALGSYHAKAQGKGQMPQYFLHVESIEIFTRDGASIYSSKAIEGKGNTGKTKIKTVAKTNKSIKVSFDGKGEKNRVVEILCRDCIVKIEYLWDENKEENNETEGDGSGSGRGTGGGGGRGGKTK